MANNENLRPAKKGEIKNPYGRPKGESKKKKLNKLLDDIIKIYNSKISNHKKRIIYNLYEIVLSDIGSDEISDTITDLYFIESEIGIKIGISKNVENRLKQIRLYSPSSRILKVIKYGGNFEKILHNKFSYLNIKGNTQIGVEWFYKNDDLHSFINDINTTKDLATMFSKFTDYQLSLFN